MSHMIRDIRSASIGAIAALIIGVPTGAMAAYVANADRVDHKHAVGAGASQNARAGKLVATNGEGRLPNGIIAKAPNSARLGGLTPRLAQSQWMSVDSDGAIIGASAAATDVTVTHPATGTYCVSSADIARASVTGTIQSQVNGYENLNLIITSLYNTSACPGELRIYTTLNSALANEPFTLTFFRTD